MSKMGQAIVREQELRNWEPDPDDSDTDYTECQSGNHPPASECEKCPQKDNCPAEAEDFSKWEVVMQ